MAIQLDSRQVKHGDIFVAIKGKNEDGNKYAIDALNNGASLAIVDDISYINSNNNKILYVKSSIEALKYLGKYYLNNSNIKTIIGITGSCGKTTTRTWIDYILSKNIETCSSIKNFNTMLGLPVCLSNIKSSTEIGIFELGTNNYGEMHELSTYLNPNIGIITNIYESHIGMFNSIEELANEKISVIDGIRKCGYLIYDGDCIFSSKIIEKCKLKNIKHVSIGFNNNCDYIVNYNLDKIIINHKSKSIEYEMGIIGKHYAYISAIVVALIDILGLDINYYLQYFNELKPLEGRGMHKKYIYNGKQFTVIDETYNASPSSMNAALEILKQFNNKKIIVIGEMLELEKHSEYYHNKLADTLKNINNTEIYFIGNKNLHNIINKHNNIKCYEKVNEEVIEYILSRIDNNNVLFLKGSNGINLKRFINYLNII